VVILLSRADDLMPFADSEELVRNSGLPASVPKAIRSDERQLYFPPGDNENSRPTLTPLPFNDN
jgi:hypothetical protein